MPHSKYIKIVKNAFGNHAINTKVRIDKGMMVRVMNGHTIDYPTQTSIKLGDGRHMEDRVGRYINHSCSPTLRVDKKQPILWANKDILVNMPLTINYFKTEDNISSPFICYDCGEWVPRVGGCDYYK